MSALTMPNINGTGKKAASILSVLALVAFIGSYAGGLIPSYALASEFKEHVKTADTRYYQTVKRMIKKDIKTIENKLALYGLDRDMRELTPREKLDEAQLINLRAEYLRDLADVKAR